MSDPQWAPDPYGRFELRYWDGSAWTEHVHQRGVPGLDPVTAGPAVVEEQPFAVDTLFPGSGANGAYGGEAQHGRRGQHGRGTSSRRRVHPLVAVGAAGAGLLGVVVLGVAALGGGQDGAVLTGASGTGTRQAFAAVPTSTAPPVTVSSAARSAGTSGKASTSARTTTRTTTKARTATTTAPKATTTKPRTTTTTPPKTSTKATPKPTTTKPRTTTTTATTAKRYKNCTAMHVDYPHGVGRPGAVDSTTGSAPVTTFYVNGPLYQANKGSDRDKDGIACEAR